MSSRVKVLLVLLATCATTKQNPIFANIINHKRTNYIPGAPLYTRDIRRAVYFHDQTVAVVDVNIKNEMQNCDIIEVYEPNEARELLGNLSMTARPTEVSFSQMRSLMYRCEILDRMEESFLRRESMAEGAFERANVAKLHIFNIFHGILPGTKWCGTGDIADNYHDLGTDTDVDRCCRTHDLCPVKIRAQHSRYNLTNYSLYSKSHCDCDTSFYHCLKMVGGPVAHMMGKFYFNFLKVSCIEDLPESINSVSSISPKRKFSMTQLAF
ncbi:phospholipase A2-like [Chelonus insularis]|uniref:phospholipase A2-like n=1 Tax=Chelonus insularis TaxID=460826 RepID=UPI00158A2508|nr:phospholipase A2-like [Chelonus insularis]